MNSIKINWNFFSILIGLFLSLSVYGQEDLYQMMERTDLSIKEVEIWADNYFKTKGTGQGSGHKQYQRWLYERKFHLDEKGYFIKPELEDKAYYKALKDMGLQARSSLSWSELGPQNWFYTSGWNPGVGRLTSVAIHPSDTTIIYVSSPGGGIWKSINGGASWSPLIDFVNSAWMNIFHLCIDPNNQNTIYASLSSGGVLKSTNAGVTWSATGSGPSSTKQVKVHPSNSSIVFAAASNGLWRSTNAGSSWTQVQTNTKEDVEFNPSNPDIMYASGSSGTSCVWRSTNNGISWTAIPSTSGITNTGRTLMAVSPNNPAVVYAVQANGSEFGRLYRSTDNGLTYTTTVVGSSTTGTNYFGYEPSGTGTGGQATYDMAICVNPLNVNEVHIAGIICWKSTNGGSSFVAETVWSYPNTTGYNHADVHGLEWINKTIYSTSDGGIYKSMNNGDDWTDLSAGLGIRQFYRIACSKTDPNVITTGAQDNGSSFRRTNGAWVDWLGADGMDNIISPTNAAIAIGTSQYGSVYKTTNSGASRSNLPKPANGNWVTPLVMHPTNHDTVFGGWQGIFKSTTGGSSWTNLSPSITSTMDALAIAPSNTKYIYASSTSNLYRTTDGGITWTTIAAPTTISSIFVSKLDPLKIWITCPSSTSRVFVSTNGGTSFTDISAGLPALAARSVVVDEDAIETIYVGMNIGVYYRDNITNAWTVHATGLPLVAINEVEFQKSGNKLRVATYGRGVWESGLQNTTSQVCNTPSGLSTTSITISGATLNWTAVSGAVNYSVEYKLSADTNWTVLSNAHTASSIGLSGLSASSSYDWRVRTNCASTSSGFVNSNFTTLSACPNVAGLTTSAITSTSATLNWTAVGAASAYNIDYKLVSAGAWTPTAGSSGTSLTINSLSAGSYEWRIQAVCSATPGNYSSANFNIYCASSASSTAAGYLDKVNLGSINRISVSDGGYFNGTALSTNIKPGTLYTMKVSPGYSGSNKTSYWRVFIDYNGDGDFVDANETVGQVTHNKTTDKSFSFTVPSTTTLGATRMRVSLSFNAYQTSCASVASGEVEDFSVNITNTPDPAPIIPSNDLAEQPLTLSVYPNPAKDILHLNFHLQDDDERIELQIFDLQGRAVLGSIMDGKKASNIKSIDVSALGSGQYILQILSPQILERKNFVINQE